MKHIRSFLGVFIIILSLATNAFGQDVVTYFHPDASGSPTVATDEYGNSLWREDYAPYGERLRQELSPRTNRLWFTGHHQDEDSALVYAGARHYDPMTGRFMGVDPAAMDPGSQFTFNRYAYANNNPYAYVDPNGAEVGVAYRAIFIADGGNAKYKGDPNRGRHPGEYAIGVGLALVAAPILAVGGYELGLLAAASPAAASSLAISAGEIAGGEAVMGGVAASVAFTAPKVFRNVKGELTNGAYILDEVGMTKHMSGGADSQFLFRVDARKATLDAAAYADAEKLWVGSKAKVPVSNGEIGVLGKTGELTNHINVYRTSKGRVHASPGTPPN